MRSVWILVGAFAFAACSNSASNCECCDGCKYNKKQSSYSKNSVSDTQQKEENTISKIVLEDL